ncbi:CocE/NonD family hydrolase [Streptomyces sp. B1866]|uniref:alpha/beta fold hydrolase n=1 Tax=Streptomyces sp. B1866 TaxID=3075431 RepID=UPI00288F318B|nr:alpha/beta fold hydrolase [Streptomyces sp. B1866]MDT3396004.1 CocE/NonD family hydrolase [Streptomyces sp. B1866]
MPTPPPEEPPDTLGSSPLLAAVAALADRSRLSSSDGPLVSVDELRLSVLKAALRTGDTGLLPDDLAEEVIRVRALGFETVRIPGADSAELDGALWTHPDDRPRPALVMPGGWTDIGWILLAALAARFQQWGYHVLAYTPRGFGASTGQVEGAGPLDVADARKALDFLDERLPRRITRTGFLGESYGSGIGQLAAAHDPRVSAVVAMSTWGDLVEAQYENETRHLAAILLLRVVPTEGRLAPETQKAFEDILGGRPIEEALAWARARAPLTVVDRLNARRVPVFYVQAWHETVFPPNQTLRLFNALRGPKRLYAGIGDHFAVELPSVAGITSERVLTDARRWFDRFLKGERNGVDTEDQVTSEVMYTRAVETHATWDAFTDRTERLYLGAPGGPRGRGALSPVRSSGWSRAVLTGGPGTPARVADALLVTGLQERFAHPKRYATNRFDAGAFRSRAAVWQTGPAGRRGLRLRGVPVLRLTYVPAADQTTFVAYLFAADPVGGGHIVTHAPFTSHHDRAGRPATAEISLQATGFDVPSGWRVLLVLTTADPFYDNANQPDTTLAFTSPAGRESHLDLPTG